MAAKKAPKVKTTVVEESLPDPVPLKRKSIQELRNIISGPLISIGMSMLQSKDVSDEKKLKFSIEMLDVINRAANAADLAKQVTLPVSSYLDLLNEADNTSAIKDVN